MQHQPVTHGHCNNSIDRRFEPFEVLIHLRLGGSTSDRRAAPRPHYADLTTAPLAARTPTNRFKDRRPGLSVSDRPGTRVSGRRLQLTSDISTRRLRSTDTATCVVRRSNNSFSDRCFAAAGPRLWNTLPVQLRHCDSLGQFKRLLKTYLFGGWDRGAL